MLLTKYFEQWIEMYKVDKIAEVTLLKYQNSLRHLQIIAPRLKLEKMTRWDYQEIINEFAKTHEKQTVQDFHHQVKGALLDAFHDGLIDSDPTYRAVIKGKPRKERESKKFLQPEEVTKLVSVLDLNSGVNKDWFILIMIKTGLRYAECLGLTVKDFDFENQTLNVDKTLQYKTKPISFAPTKNPSSVRQILIDWQIVGQFRPLLAGMDPDDLIFVEKDKNGKYKHPYNSTFNTHLKNLCIKAGVPIVSTHSLRHTHASLLLSQGVSIQTISKRLGHSEVTTTQEVYVHILDDLKAQDNSKMTAVLSQLGV